MNSQNLNESARKSEELNTQKASSSSTREGQTPETPSRSEELKETELKETNGGLLGIGDDNSSLTAITQGTVNLSHTDENGDTESTNLDFGTGSLLNTTND
jgi:hypothetical protein